MHPKRLTVWLFLLCGLLFSGAVTATPKQLTDQELTALAAKVDGADQLFKKAKYEQALLIYQEAYALTEEPTMIFSMAQCYRNLEKNKEAATHYRKFLSEAPQDNELRPLAQQLLDEVETKIPKGATTDPTKAAEPKPTTKKSRFLFVGAGAASAAGAGFGVTALLASNKVKAEQKPDGDEATTKAQTDKSRLFALASDLSFVAAVGFGLSGFVLSKKENERTTLLLGPSQVAISVEF